MSNGIRNLILTADDFGACNYIDRGIYKGIEEGVVTCVSAFVNFKPRTANEPGGKYVGSEAALLALRDKHPEIPIGLHLTINTGTPVLQNNKVTELIGNADSHGVRYFKHFDKFSPNVYFTPWIMKQVGREARAQIKRFRDIFGQDPNHISCHFGILFLFNGFLEELLKQGGIKGIPVRNPVLIFQTQNKERNERNKRTLEASSKFFKKRSKMREAGKEKAFKWLFDSMDSALGLLTEFPGVKKRLRLLAKNGCVYPDYTIGSLYKRGKNDWEGGFSAYLGQIPPFIPAAYPSHKNRKGGVVCEFICHLGSGRLPKDSPIGINHKYFPGRKLELERLISARDILRINSVNMVDFGFLEPPAA